MKEKALLVNSLSKESIVTLNCLNYLKDYTLFVPTSLQTDACQACWNLESGSF